MKKLKKTTIILIVACIIGLSLLLYPTVSNYWNEKHSTKAINEYVEEIQQIDTETYQKMWQEAVEYNEDLNEKTAPYALDSEMRERYMSCLNVGSMGVMGYIEIPKIDVALPLFHTVDTEVLERGAGHLDWSSLPTGGANTHCVVSGHRGLPNAKMFTDLNKLREGDVFDLVILGEVLTYEVDQIRTVEPDQVKDLLVEENEDYCSLVTCTPYGINTHRLLIRGHRIENLNNGAIYVVSEAVVIDPMIIAPIFAFPLIFTLFMMIMLKKPEQKEKDADGKDKKAKKE